MRLRNSHGSESSVSSTTLTKCSRFIFHPLKEIRACSLRVAVLVFFVIVLIIFTIVFVFLFVFFVVRFLAQEKIGSNPPIRDFWVEIFWTHSAHARWYARAAALQLRLFPRGSTRRVCNI